MSGWAPGWAPAWGAAAVLLLVAVACTPLYLPPVPSELPQIEPTLLLRDVRIEDHEVRAVRAPTVTFRLEELPHDGFLAVQWFPPAGGEVASASVWLAWAQVGSTVRVRFPSDVARDRAGRWRAVLSWDGTVVRQVAWNEPGAGALETGALGTGALETGAP
ncbi:MAG: hypothetical protein WD336_07695 [Trueperaceae bacterium]